MTAEKKASVVEWGIAAVRALIPIMAIGWYANQAISRIEDKANAAVAQVAAAVADLRTAQEVHVRTDDQRQAYTDQRLDRVERRQDALDGELGRRGIRTLGQNLGRP